MGERTNPGRRKRVAPVQVHYFPKPVAEPARTGPRPSPVDSASHRITLPEIEVPVTRPPADGKRRKKGGGRGKRRKGAAAPGPQVPSTPHLTPQQVAEISLFGHHLFETGQLSEARVIFEGLVGMGLEDAFPHTMLGTIYLSQGDPEHALALFEAALALDARDLAARVYRGEIRLDAGSVTEGLDDLRAALQQGGLDDPFVLRARRLIRMQQERARRSR